MVPWTTLEVLTPATRLTTAQITIARPVGRADRSTKLELSTTGHSALTTDTLSSAERLSGTQLSTSSRITELP